MSEPSSFRDLIQRVRVGEEAAARELVQRYEPTIRRVVRFRLANNNLGALLDSMDICQSVLASFFVRAAAGAFDIDRPEQLLNLLATMARNKLLRQARRHKAQRRDHRRNSAPSEDQAEFVCPSPSPSQQVVSREMLQEVERRLSTEEQQLVALRSQGLEWADIAAQLGGDPRALRKKLSRALNRVTQELGIDESTDE